MTMTTHGTATLLRCRQCHTPEQPDTPTAGPYATGAENRRGGRAAYHIRCGKCGWEWWSVTKRAAQLSKQADKNAQAARP
jgi:hypothetical protein